MQIKINKNLKIKKLLIIIVIITKRKGVTKMYNSNTQMKEKKCMILTATILVHCKICNKVKLNKKQNKIITSNNKKKYHKMYLLQNKIHQ